MVEYKIVLGVVSVSLAVIGYGIYFRQIFLGKVKPHAFTWFVWSLTTGIVFAAQIVRNAGAGAWVTGALCLVCFSIFVISLFKGQKTFVILDWIFLAVTLFALLLWKVTRDPLLSVILITITDALGILPTLRKSYLKPYEENITLFAFNSVRSLISIFALASYTITTWLYPSMLVVMNALVVLVIIFRKPYFVIKS